MHRQETLKYLQNIYWHVCVSQRERGVSCITPVSGSMSWSKGSSCLQWQRWMFPDTLLLSQTGRHLSKNFTCAQITSLFFPSWNSLFRICTQFLILYFHHHRHRLITTAYPCTGFRGLLEPIPALMFLFYYQWMFYILLYNTCDTKRVIQFWLKK